MLIVGLIYICLMCVYIYVCACVFTAASDSKPAALQQVNRRHLRFFTRTDFGINQTR